MRNGGASADLAKAWRRWCCGGGKSAAAAARLSRRRLVCKRSVSASDPFPRSPGATSIRGLALSHLRFIARQTPRARLAHMQQDRLVPRTVQQNLPRLAQGVAGPSSSRARGCRMSEWRPALAGLSGLSAGGLPVVRKVGPFSPVSFIGVCQVSCEVVTRSWMPGRGLWWW